MQKKKRHTVSGQVFLKVPSFKTQIGTDIFTVIKTIGKFKKLTSWIGKGAES